MYGSGDVERGKYDNIEVEAIKGTFARKSHNKNSGLTQSQWPQQPHPILVTNEHDWISQIQLFEVYPSTAAYEPGVQGECRNSHQKIPKYEKQHWRHVIHGTYNPTTVTHETHG